MSAVRLAAAQVLVALERGRTTLADLTEKHRTGIESARDRALFLEIAVGSVRWQAELDACLAANSTRPLAALTPEVRSVLRTAAYQLLHLDRVPSHAAVSESVEVIRKLGQARAPGFVNAVLRSLLRGDPRRGLPQRPRDPSDLTAALDYLSVTLSHPRWLVQRWIERVGFDAAERWCFFNNSPPSLAVRPVAGTMRADIEAELKAAGVETTPGKFVADSLVLPPGSLTRLPADVRDRIRIQDEGSQLIATALAARPGDRVADLCASPGGKTMMVAEMIGPGGQVVASDFRRPRVLLLRDQLARAGFRVPIVALDVTRTLPFPAVFDRVVLDAPCSGLGTVRRDPDVKWARKESDLPALAETQASMLRNAAEIVRAGGSLLYATCSSEPEENEGVVDEFLSTTSDFAVEPITEVDPQLVTPRGFLLTNPARDSLDVFFAARLVRLRGA